MNLTKLIWSLVAGAATLVSMPDDASAYVGYVCETQFRRYADYGNHGYVYVSAYTEPGCAGSWVIGAVYCTTGGTNGNCSPGNLYSSAEILALVQNLQRAAAADQKVNIVATSGGAGMWVSFLSN
jgi:hypothetical protein